MLNINLGHNRELMEKCKRLKDYSVFIDGIRKRQAEGMPLNLAVEETVNESIQNGILEDILRKNRAEVIDMVLNEYDQEFHIKNEKEISFKEGECQGRYTALVDLVCRKLRKDKAPEVIAEELEEDLTSINLICNAARAFAPDYNYLKVFHALSEQQLRKIEPR